MDSEGDSGVGIVRRAVNALGGVIRSRRGPRKACAADRPVVAIAWTTQGNRCRDLARLVGGIPLVLTRPKRTPRFLIPVTYIYNGMRTLWLLLKIRPGFVIVQHPPIFPSLLSVILSRRLHFRVITDAHPSAFATKGDWLSRAFLPLT